MHPFEYRRASTIADATHAKGRFIAGGTNLVDLMKADVEIREWMSGNLCRCSAYPNIVAAIAEVAREKAR